jgi:hypothetical protein
VQVKRNLTVQLDPAVIDYARILAARRATSISRLIADEITRLVAEDERYQHAKPAALTQLEAGFHMGGGSLPAREALYDR